MNNNINIAEILKDYPKGTKLYSPLLGNVTLESINSYSTNATIEVKVDNSYYCFYKTGTYYNHAGAECLLFPSSEMRDWTKFFKRGDVVWSKTIGMYVIFEGWANDDYTKFNTTIDFYEFDASFDEEVVCDTALYVKVSDKGRAMFIANAEKYYRGKYNSDTLRVEQPVKFECPFKPFDKVLVRDNIDEKWLLSIFGCYEDEVDKDYPYVCLNGRYCYCIPYTEQTAHLIGTTNNN